MSSGDGGRDEGEGNSSMAPLIDLNKEGVGGARVQEGTPEEG